MKRWPVLVVAGALSLGAAVSLGLARFSYTMLLPPMRADLGWSYLVGGAMNTFNAIGYLLGVLASLFLLRRHDARAVFLFSMAATGLLLGAHGVVTGEVALFALRVLSGVGSALTFVAGGVLVAALLDWGSADPDAPDPPLPGRGLVLGTYYGGVGLGIVASAFLVPAFADRALPHAWQGAWWALGGIACASALLALPFVPAAPPPKPEDAGKPDVDRRLFDQALRSYGFFGLGYIGYMTFIVSVLADQGWSRGAVTAFYASLGVAVVASPRLWAGLLQRSRGGEAMGLLNALLAAAALLPILTVHPVAIFASGLLFGAVFLSVVASTTAFVTHNLPPRWVANGVVGFTFVFSVGQIIGPTFTGWFADGFGSVRAGLVFSFLCLVAASLFGYLQKPTDGAKAPG